MLHTVSIGTRIIGPQTPCFIIAEAGVNHNGSFDIACRLIDAAKEAGADAVKFQTFTADKVATSYAACAAYQLRNGGETTQLVMLRRLELAFDAFRELKAHCDGQEILFLSTAHTEDVLDFVDSIVPAHKIASGDLTNTLFLKHVARCGKPILLSTGMATLDEVSEAVAAIRGEGNQQIVLLHCTSEYPCPREDVNLSAMQTMGPLGCLLGYSDHTEGVEVPLMAARLGATVIEKHFTLDRRMPGPDHKASLEPRELRDMITLLRSGAHAITTVPPEVLGSGTKAPTSREVQMAQLVRKSIVAAKDVAAGDLLTLENLTVKRPGTGLPPKELYRLLGWRARRPISRDGLLQMADVEMQS